MAGKPPARREHVRVFLSSTYRDNEERRRELFKAIERIGMQVAGMELFLAEARPTVEQCERAVAECDVFVGIIAHRYGWIPDGLGHSITEHEYERAGERGIARLMFLIRPGLPVDLDRDFDAMPDRWKKQDRLAEFRKRIEAASDNETPAIFSSDADLASLVTASLVKWFDEQRGAEGEQGAAAEQPPWSEGTPASLAAEIAVYKSKLVDELSELHLVGFSKAVRVKLRFDDLFVPQNALRDERFTGEDRFAHAKDAEKELGSAGRQIPFADAFREAAKRSKRHGIVLLGDPGSGKTTQLKRVALWLASESAAVLGLPEGAVPFLVPLRVVTRTDRPFLEVVGDYLARNFKTAPGFVDRVLMGSTAAFLLDGLDEVTEPRLRGKVSQWIKAATKDLGRHRFAVTCRYAGYGDEASLGPDFLVLHLSPLTSEQVREFVQRWFLAVESTREIDHDQARARATETARNLTARLEAGGRRAARVAELTQNPLLLTAICLVHLDQKVLPEKRADLLEECVQVLLERWRRAKEIAFSLDAKQARAVLQPLAYWMHSEPSRQRAGADDIAPELRQPLLEIQWKGGDEWAFLRTIRDESGLLVGWSDREFGFLHLAFQEYLAAREIRRRYSEGDASALRKLASRFGESWWREVTLLLLGLDEPSLFEPLFRDVVKLDAFAADQGLVNDCLLDSVRVSPAPFLELLVLEPGIDKKLWERQLAALRVLQKIAPEEVEQHATGLATHPHREIAELFMPREVKVEVSRAEIGLEFALIRGDEFDMGAPKEERGSNDDERPVHRVKLSPFLLSTTTVTNEHYARFLAANPAAPEPQHWGDRRFNQPRQPVVGVSSEEALAFCRWAGGELPTEAQWEYACRAGTKTRFWSGDEDEDLARVGWYAANSEGRLHAVAEKPANPWGLFDMHGNTWEWCLDWFGRYPSKKALTLRAKKGLGPFADPHGPERPSDRMMVYVRVMRGGSFGDDADGCRSACRDRSHPDNRWDHVGFRVALPTAPSSD